MQREPVAKITGADEYGPMLQWSTHWVELVGMNLYAAPVLTDAARDVLAEHRRRVEVEGFTPERGDKDLLGDASVLAATTYTGGPSTLPWPLELLKPGTPRQMLVKAGALILAAIEQIDRRAAK
ncbi:hypothetical protein [Burkholderia sp. AU38729]|uniref:hypothetical protein n=1 Tax=Burkholderia sp. AU38729 TaxID=2879633 RepID=UPI001CF5C260|nr:hypothetical protein [Burkholderia sp. AU38729]MCA8065518.1 hypothetical protein [Burkholderia sp. AU38729]